MVSVVVINLVPTKESIVSCGFSLRSRKLLMIENPVIFAIISWF